MSIARGSRSFLNVAEETTLNSGVLSGAWWNVPIISETLGENINSIVSTQIQPDRTIPDARGGNITAAGGITTDFALSRYGKFFEHLLGATATPSFAALAAVTSSTAYVRGAVVIGPGGNTKRYRCVVSGTTSATPAADFVVNDGTVFSSGTSQWVWVADSGARTGTTWTGSPTLPTKGLMIERGFFGAAAIMYSLITGVRVESLVLSQPQEGIAQAVWNLLAMNATASSSTTVSGTPAAPTDEGVTGFESGVEILNSDGTIQQSTVVKTGSLTISNNFETDNFRLGSRFRKDLVEKRRACTGDLELFFEDMTYYNRFLAETVFGLRWSWYHGAEYLSITFPECKLFGDPQPKIGGEGSISSRFGVTAFKRLASYDAQVAYDIIS